MACHSVQLPDGTRAIVCGPKPRRQRCSSCNRLGATLLCDWKIGDGRTCDKPICADCTHSPAPGKDLCPEHAAEWKARTA